MRNFEENIKKTGAIMKVIGILTLIFSFVLLYLGVVRDAVPSFINIAFSIACINLGKRINNFDDQHTGKYLCGCFLMLLLMSLVTRSIGGLFTIIAYINVIFGLDSFYRLKKYHKIKEKLKKIRYSITNNAVLIVSVTGFVIFCFIAVV